MAIIPPFLCAIVLGAALYVLVLRRLPARSPLEMVLAFWLGFGFCSLLTFLSVVASAGHFNPGIILSLSIFFFICAVAYLWYEISSQLHFNIYRIGLKDFGFLVLAVLLWLTQTMIAARNPYGDWDAWAFWNYIPHYFFTGGHQIQDLYTIASEARHPWLLPSWLMFGGAWAWQETLSFPIISAQVFSILLLAVVYYAILEESDSIPLAVLGGASLFSLSGYTFHSMSQYADVVMAGLFLLNVLWVMRLSSDAQVTWREGLGLGLMLGLMAFLKDEGMMCAGIIMCLTALVTRMGLNFWGPLIGAFSFLLIASLIVKSWMLNLPPEPRHLNGAYLIDFKRWGMVACFGWEILLKFLGAGALLYPLIAIGFLLRRTFRRDDVLALAIVGVYAGAFIIFLVMRENLRWYIDGAAYRFVYQLLPLLVIICFSNLGRLKKIDGQNQKNIVIYGLIVGAILGVIGINANKSIAAIRGGESPLTASSHFPGESFVPLPQQLKGIDTVGYVTNYISSIYEQDRPAVFNYHQAKFAMAPVILDRFHPWDHEYVVLFFFPSKDFAPIFIPWPHRIVHKVNDNVLLIQRLFGDTRLSP